jgi:hypothetical protein
MIKIRSDQELIEEFIKNMRASLTCALTRKMTAVHGSCLRNTRARLVFPVTTGVKLKNEMTIRVNGDYDCMRSLDVKRIKNWSGCAGRVPESYCHGLF